MQFSRQEYLIIFIAFVYGFVAQEFFQGWGQLIRQTKKKDLSSISIYYISWTLLLFGLLISFWWDYWDRSDKITLNIGYFMVTLIPPFIFYLISILLFPSSSSIDVFFKREYIYLKLPSILWLLAALLSSDLMISFIADVYKVRDALFLVIAILLCFTSAILKSRILYRVSFIMGWILLIAHFFVEG